MESFNLFLLRLLNLDFERIINGNNDIIKWNLMSSNYQYLLLNIQASKIIYLDSLKQLIQILTDHRISNVCYIKGSQ